MSLPDKSFRTLFFQWSILETTNPDFPLYTAKDPVDNKIYIIRKADQVENLPYNMGYVQDGIFVQLANGRNIKWLGWKAVQHRLNQMINTVYHSPHLHATVEVESLTKYLQNLVTNQEIK